MYRNSEGYKDPTAGMALGRMMRDYRREQKEIWRRQYEMKHQRKVYVVSRYAGDIEKNTEDAIRACRFLIKRHKQPVASHLLYPSILGLDDTNKDLRELGLMYGLSLIAVCDEVYCFVMKDGMSEGMEAEIREAKKLGKAIHYVKMEDI